LTIWTKAAASVALLGTVRTGMLMISLTGASALTSAVATRLRKSRSVTMPRPCEVRMSAHDWSVLVSAAAASRTAAVAAHHTICRICRVTGVCGPANSPKPVSLSRATMVP